MTHTKIDPRPKPRLTELLVVLYRIKETVHSLPDGETKILLHMLLKDAIQLEKKELLIAEEG